MYLTEITDYLSIIPKEILTMEFELQPIRREIVINGFNSIYYFEFDKDFTHLPEKHDFWELVYVDSGEITAVTDGLGQTLTQGQVIFHRPGEVHAHISNNLVPNNMLVVSFTTESPEMMFFDRKVFSLEKVSKTLLTLFINEAKNALDAIPNRYDDKRSPDFSRAPFGSLQLLECYLTEFLLTLRRVGEETGNRVGYSESSRAIAQSSLLELIIGYLKSNVYGNVTIADICGSFFVGKSQLCSLFASSIGMSPIEYFSTLKIAEAKKLLRREELSVSRISDMLGYLSIHTFSRAFKRSVGCSPTEYRKSIRGF